MWAMKKLIYNRHVVWPLVSFSTSGKDGGVRFYTRARSPKWRNRDARNDALFRIPPPSSNVRIYVSEQTRETPSRNKMTRSLRTANIVNTYRRGDKAALRDGPGGGNPARPDWFISSFCIWFFSSLPSSARESSRARAYLSARASVI